jgi:hypothetical protein
MPFEHREHQADVVLVAWGVSRLTFANTTCGLRSRPPLTAGYTIV